MGKLCLGLQHTLGLPTTAATTTTASPVKPSHSYPRPTRILPVRPIYLRSPRGTMEAFAPRGISEDRSGADASPASRRCSHPDHWPAVREHFLLASTLVRNQPQAASLGSCEP